MNIGNLNGSAFSPVYAPRGRSGTGNCSSDGAESAPTSNDSTGGGICTTPLPPTTPEAPGGLTVQESHLALQIRSRTQVRTSSDGTTRERESTKLRFHYDVTTADGQHIELNVKAKVQQVSIEDAAGNSVSKTQVKLQFSLLQQGVAEGLSPLQSDEVPSDTQSGIADRLQAFLTSVGDALQQFIEGDKLTADDLVKTTVDTFNTLVDALADLLFAPAAPTAPTGSEAPPALPPGGGPDQVPAPTPVPLENTATIPAAPTSDSSPPPQVSPLPEEGNVASEPLQAETPQPETPAVADAPAIPADTTSLVASPEPTEVSVAPAVDPDAAVTPSPSATHVLQSVRLRFMQSLTQIIRTLTPAEQPGDRPLATFQRLDYRSSLSLKVRSTSLVDLNA